MGGEFIFPSYTKLVGRIQREPERRAREEILRIGPEEWTFI